MSKTLSGSATAWRAAMRRSAVQSVLVSVVATAAHAAPTVDDCPCRHAQRANAPASIVSGARPSLLALDTRAGAGFVIASAAGGGRPAVPPVTAGRVGGEVAAAVGAAAIGGVLSASLGWGLAWSCQSEECSNGVIAGAFAAYSTIIAAAVKAAGSAGDQHVPFSYPFLGAVAGAAIGYPAFMHAVNGSTDGEALITLALLLPPIGAVIGAIAGRRWDEPPAGSLRLMEAPSRSAWNAETAPGPLPGGQLTLATLSF